MLKFFLYLFHKITMNNVFLDEMQKTKYKDKIFDSIFT